MTQETLEEAAEIFARDMSGIYYKELNNSFIAGAKWEQKRSYSEEEVHHIIQLYSIECYDIGQNITYDEWFEQFKK